MTALRRRFPALSRNVNGRPAAFLDGPGGSQTPDVVADAVRDTLSRPLSNRGDLTVAQENAERAVLGAREALADLLGAPAGGVVFGRSFTQLTFDVSRAKPSASSPAPKRSGCVVERIASPRLGQARALMRRASSSPVRR